MDNASTTVVNVVIPVLRGRAVFVVDKGRPWSVLEHLLLEALSRSPATAAQLAKEAHISRRVVVEAIIRLMRAGWAELSHKGGSVIFRATARGVAAAKQSELPNVLERRQRPINFIVDLVAGDVFRNRDWKIEPEGELSERAKREPFVWLEPESVATAIDPKSLVDALLDDDETFVDADGAGLAQRFVVVAVRDGMIEGLPPGKDLPALRQAILKAARQASPVRAAEGRTTFSIPSVRRRLPAEKALLRDVTFDNDDLILDGPAHREELKTLLARAKSKVLVHSTFIDEAKFLALLPDITKAVQRGVRVHVFWGQNEELGRVVTTQEAIARLRKNVLVSNLNGLILHPFSTGSHAKVLIADSGPNGKYVAVLGSCNWFTSGFASYDVSVRLRDPVVVRDVVTHLGQLTFSHDGVWTDLASELVHVSQRLDRSERPHPHDARCSIVLGSQHTDFVLSARDVARTRIFVTSHRLGAVSNPGIIVPLAEAASKRSIAASIYYSRRTAPVGEQAETSLVAAAGREGVAVKAIEWPRLHAKVLAWDDDFVVVTSLNWLSGDPVDQESLREIGVYVEAKGVANVLINHFLASTNQAEL